MNNSRITLIVGLLLAVLVGLVIFAGAGNYSHYRETSQVPAAQDVSVENDAPLMRNKTGSIQYKTAKVHNGEYDMPMVTAFPDAAVEDKVNRRLQEIGDAWGCDEIRPGFTEASFDADVKVTYADSDIFSLNITYGGYCGGAYPFYAHVPVTFDMNTGEEVSFASLFTNFESDKSSILNLIFSDMRAERKARNPSAHDECEEKYLNANTPDGSVVGAGYYFTSSGWHVTSEFAHVSQACEEDIVEPVQKFRQFFDERSILSRFK